MKITTFFKETRNEMRNVVWPTRTKALIYTLIIIIFSVAVGYMLGGFDTIFRVLLRSIIS